MKERPVGWLEELYKLEDMSNAAASPHLLPSGLTWPVKFRLINRNTVLPSQVTTLTLPLSSPDNSFYERLYAEREKVGCLRSTEDLEVLHW